ncbi:MAG TPA: zf-HC2 domain-containing protein [Thermomicrobiales bacterium]|nr:zf-HC2 domain-containing protein [Thermomicrobiales bacterium]
MNIASTHTSHLSDDLLNAWLDDEATGLDSDAIRAHLAICERCRESLASLRSVKSLVAELPEVQLPRSFTLTQDQAKRDPAPASTIIRLLPVTRILGIAAVIAFLVLGVATALGPVGQSDENQAADQSPLILSATGTNPEDETSLNESLSRRAAAPGEVVDQGLSATSSNSALDTAAPVLAPVSTTDDTPDLRTAWIASGIIAVVSLAAWAVLARPGFRTQHRSS